MNSPIHVVAHLEVKPGMQPQFKSIAAELIENSRKEAGTVGYEWHTADERSYHVFERFTDNAGALVHLGNLMPLADRFLGSCDIQRMTVYGEANSELRAALANFGASFMPHTMGFHR